MGFFLVFEGPEGSGKSTQARLLATALGQAGYRVVLTREPGGTTISEGIRAILLDPDNYAMLAETEALLYAASRAQLVGQVIRPALEDGAVVVCDRFVDSSLAYQVGGRGLRFADVEGIQRLATGGLRPDLRILLDLPVSVGLARRFADSPQVNRLDAADQAFHERVRACYHDLVASDPEGWVVLNAEAPASDLAAQITEIVVARLRVRGERLAHAAKSGGGE
jgi:dTMP kinase